MLLDIVTVDSGWILQKIAERILQHMPDGISCDITHQPLFGYDAYYYCDIQNCYHYYKQHSPETIHIGYLTHAHENNPSWLHDMFDQQGVWELDGLKSMNQRYTDMARSIGWTKPILTTTPPADAEDFSLRKTRLLIANRGGFPGYGHDFMLSLSDGNEEFLSGHFSFTFLGNGWEPIINKYHVAGIQTCHDPDDTLHYPYDYEWHYGQADYLLVPILWTAGPYCAMEAHLTGLPIIASDVGLINYEVNPDYVYPPGDKDKLLEILFLIRRKMQDRRNKIKSLNTWKTYTESIVNFIKECLHAR